MSWGKFNMIMVEASNRHNLTGSTSRNYNPIWTSDGNHIRFVSDRDGSHKFYLMDLDGSNVHMIPFEAGINFNIINYAWSLDFTHVAYSAPGGQYYQIYVADADGSNTHLLSDTVVEGAEPFIWTGDSKSIIFVASKPGQLPDGIKNGFVPPFPNGLWM